jgi:SAM-dependent methyltransferase
MDNKNIYEKFDWVSLKEEDLKDKILKVLEFIPEDVKTIVDIGCGNGAITNVLGKQYEVTAVDRSKEALKHLETKTVLASADDIPLASASYDLVFSSELLEHLENDTFAKTVNELKRLTRKYIFITVPNDENPDKLAIKCPNCKYVYNRPNHLRSFKTDDFSILFPEYRILQTLAFGSKVRYYNPAILKIKKSLTPAISWIPKYWIEETKRNTICPKCENEFKYPYKFNPIATGLDIINVALSPKKPYWLFVLMKKK